MIKSKEFKPKDLEGVLFLGDISVNGSPTLNIFRMNILKYSSKSGRFTARAVDGFGHSVLIGKIFEGKIEFRRVYERVIPQHMIEDRVHAFGEGIYSGTIEIDPSKKIFAEGSFQSIYDSEEHKKTWMMNEADSYQNSISRFGEQFAECEGTYIKE